MCNNQIMGITITCISFEKLIFQPSCALYTTSVALLNFARIIINLSFLKMTAMTQEWISRSGPGQRNLVL